MKNPKAVVAVLALVSASCGGSVSETPWPTEPENVDLGPVGESQREERFRSNDSKPASERATDPQPQASAKPKIDLINP